MSLLTRLLEADNSSQAPANLAKVAKVSTRPGEVSQLSQLSQHPERKETTCTTGQLSQLSQLSHAPDVEGATYARLLALAEREGRDAALVDGLTAADLRECEGLPDATLAAYLSALKDAADRMAGRVPDGETAITYCKGCGPIWTHPAIAAAIPKVNGWPTLMACPWCLVKARGRYVPRPAVTACTCAHWKPDPINPDGGRGECACGPHYPGERHRCEKWEPRP